MDLIGFLKGLYYSAEDKWYNVLDAIDQKQIPIYRIVDPIDSIVPSFLLFILTSIFLLVLIAYLMQFYSPLEVSFVAVDTASQATLSGVAISGVINGTEFSKVTGEKGEAKIIIQGQPANLFEKIGSLLFAKEETISATLSAEKSGYTKIQKKEYDLTSKEAEIRLTAITLADANRTFASSTEVELLDNLTSERISDDTSFIKYNCANKGISIKTSSDGHDGVIDGKFKLIEPNCNFVIKGAYAKGYARLDAISTELDPNQSLHAVRLSKTGVPTKGAVKIYVHELNSSPQISLPNIQIRLLDLSGNSMEDGTTDYSGVMQKEVNPGTYLITATSPDGNYFSLNSDMNQLIVVSVDSLSEKTIYLKKMDPALVRFLKIKVVDYNGRTPLKDVIVFPQQLTSNADGNRDARGIIGFCANSCKTDSNGLITVSGLSSVDEGKIVVSLSKENYVIKIFEPQFFKVGSSEYEIVELEKVDYSENGNAGKGLVKVRAKSDLRGLLTTAFMYFNSPELNINGISLIQTGIRTDSNGEALFLGLRNRRDKAYYAKASYDGVEGKSLNKAVGVGETVLFDINIDAEVSYLEVKLIGYGAFEVANKERAVLTITSLDVTSFTPLVETLTYNPSTQTFKSRMLDRGRSYRLLVNLENYVPVSKNVTLNLIGRNLYNETMYPDNNEIMVVFKGLYENSYSQEPANFLDLNNVLEESVKGYYGKVDFVVGKSLKDGNILGALRVNDRMSINQASVTQDYLKQIELYSCLPQEKIPYNDDNYYVQSEECIKSSRDFGKQVSAVWDGNVARGVYSITSRLEFTPNAINGEKLDLNYSGKQNDFEYISEDRNSVTYEIGASLCRISPLNPSCAGLYFYSSLNGNSTGSQLFDYNYVTKRFSNYRVQFEIEKDYANPLGIQIFNNHPAQVDLKLTAYTHGASMDSFNDSSNGNGHFYLDSNSTIRKKVLDSNIKINPFKRSDLISADVFTIKEKASSFIVLVAELSTGEKYFLFLDTVSQGRNLFLISGNFLSGIPNQIFHASVINSDENPVLLNTVEWAVLGNCQENNVLASGTGSIVNDSFSMQIDGVYEYEQDCLSLRIIAQDFVYRELRKNLIAGTGGIDDPELSCTTIGVVDSTNNSDAYLQWGNLNKVIVKNNCDEEIRLEFESRLVLLGTNECNSLLPNETCNVFLKAQNSDYDANVMFSDVLGVFPVYVRAKLISSRKNFSQIKMIRVHVQNSAKCFAISKDMFDLKTNPELTEFIITNSCQYIDFGDYYIPKASLELSSVDLNDEKPKYDFITFDYNINIRGGSYMLQTNQILRSEIKLNYPKSVMDYPKSDVDGSSLKKYSNFKAEVDPNLDAYSERMMFRWTDDSANEFYGAKIEGPIKISYYDKPPVTVNPAFNFDFSSGVISCTGSDPTDPENHCIDDGYEQVPNGNVASMKFGLFYVNYPRGKIKSIEYDVVGDPDSSILIVYTNIFVDYNEAQTVSVPSGNLVTNTIASGRFTIAPIEGMVFLLRNYSNPKVTAAVQNQANLCKLVLTKRAWIGGDKVYWVQKHVNNYQGANTYCSNINNRLFKDNDTYGMVTSFSSIPSNIIDNWRRDQNQFNWMGVGNGFWTNECTGTTCKVINKTAAGFDGTSLINMDKFDVDSYVPFCQQEKPATLSVTVEDCNRIGVVCDANTGICSESTPELFDSFLAEGFIEVLNPSTTVQVTRATTNSGELDNSSVMIWIEGGILKAMFLGKDYVGYNDSTIELSIVDKGVVGDLYGTINIVDYVNKGN